MLRSGIGATIGVALLAVGAAPALGATITVNGTGDSAAEDASCTLREAITSANTNAESGNGAGGAPECVAGQADPVVDLIGFQIAGAGPHVILPATALPEISEVVTIDGGTDTNPGPGADEIRVDGGGTIVTGLDVESDDVEIHDLGLTRFSSPAIDLAGTDGALVAGNLIGTDSSGAPGLGNTTGVRVGTTGAAATNATITGNTVSGNSETAIRISDAVSSGHTIQGNRIGTTPDGLLALPNSTGIVVTSGADEITIGGAAPGQRNLISGNSFTGISIENGGSADPSTGIEIIGNRVGTGAGGETPIPNPVGISLFGTISGAEISGNLVSGNTDEGIRLSDAAAVGVPTGTVISGNLVGTDKDGVEPLGNGDSGIEVASSAEPITGTTIGGTTGLTPGGACTGACNVVADNGSFLTDSGILVGGADASGTQILGNHVGVDRTGAAALGNFGRSLGFGAGGAGIVAGSPAAPNVIAGSGAEAVFISSAAEGVTVQSNLIGVSSDGVTVLGPGSFGILVQSGPGGHLIGGKGAGEGNRIVGSGNSGVRIEGAVPDNAILANSINGNGDLGIDLFGGIGVDPNDALDADAGPNDGQNHPELRAAVAGSSTAVAGELHSTPDGEFRIEVFANAVPDPSGHGEGEAYLGAFEVSTDGAGDAAFATVVDGIAGVGDAVSATATELDALGEPLSTSEFGPNVEEGCDITGTAGDDPVGLLTGTPADEVICGLGGNDVIDGGGGNDVIVGGAGTDEADYSLAPGEIEADLGAGTVSGPGADGDDLVVEVENVRGSDFDDVITGDGADNFIQANAGKDTLKGLDGDDELKGGIGGDTLKGGSGDDELKSQDGGDVLRGQGGDDDDLSAGPGKDNLNGGGGNSDHCNGGGNTDDTPARGCESTSSIP